MVTTRRQQQQEQQQLATGSTPKVANRQQHNEGTPTAAAAVEPSPATPHTAAPQPVPNGKQVGPLKSALKQARPGVDGGREGQEEGAEATPGGAGIKKRVRIHSSSNMVHVFQTSLTTDEAAAADGQDGDATPESGPRRRVLSAGHRRVNPAHLPRYHRFMSGVFSDIADDGSSSPAAGRRAGASAASGSGREEAGGGWSLLGVVYTLCWMLASSALIFANKRLMVDHGFRFPFALTSLGQAASTLLALLAAELGLAPLRRPPPLRDAFTRLMPISFSFAASLFLGNASYLGLSVAFINIMKAATPLVTLAVGLAMRLERPALGTLLATLLIAVGTAVSTTQEVVSDHFHWLSFLAFTASVVFEGVRVVLTEKLMGQAQYNVMEALVYLGPFTFAFLAAGAVLFEWGGLSTLGWHLMCTQPNDFAAAAAISFLVNLFCYLSIKHVSATSFKVAGCLKNVLVVWGGILQGDLITGRQLQGYAISLGGFLLFSASRLGNGNGAGKSGNSQRHRTK